MIEADRAAEPPGDPMPTRSWSRRLLWHFWCSAAILAVNIGIIVWARTSRVPGELDSPASTPSWREYAAIVLTSLIPAALFGLSAAWVRKDRKDHLAARMFFAVAALIGVLSVFCGHEVWKLSHLGCADQCAASVPSYAALWWAALVSALPAVVVPALLALIPPPASASQRLTSLPHNTKRLPPS